MAAQPANDGTLPRALGVWGGAAITVGVMIGSGIYRTPATIAGQLGDPALILLLWVAGGLLCLCGAFAYAELATMYPRSGGLYVFLHEGFGPRTAFVFGWTYLLITQPLALGGIATVFAEHVNQLLGTHLDTRIITCATILALTVVNVTGLRRGAGLAIVLTGVKVAALLFIVVAAAVLTEGDAAHFVATPAPRPLLLALAPVMAAILWTYDGWSDVSAVAEEVREPQRRIPRIFLLCTLGTTGLYVAVNAAYIWLVPLAEMRATATVAPVVMERLLGPAGGTVVALLILISTLGATHGSIIVGARVVFAQARDGLLFAFPGRVHPTFRTPAAALWVQAALACGATLWLRHFERLMGGFVFTMWVFYGLSAVALFVLRVRRPDAPRPFRCWGYPVVPGLFVLAAASMTLLAIRESPGQMLMWLAVLLAGLPAYSLWRAAARRRGA